MTTAADNRLAGTENTNWIVTVYDAKNRVLDSWKISDRTEHEAFNESVNDVLRVENVFDWSMMPEGFFTPNDSQTNH